MSAASEATLSSCQSRFAIYVGIVRACNQEPGPSIRKVLGSVLYVCFCVVCLSVSVLYVCFCVVCFCVVCLSCVVCFMYVSMLRVCLVLYVCLFV